MYRVRRSWADASSQIGAYEVLQNARIAAHAAGIGYSVFDDAGNAVYTAKEGDWYRVRSSWADSASQVGAYWSLDIAKSYADSTQKTVFDWDGNAIYVGQVQVKTMYYTAKMLKKVGKHLKGKTYKVTRDKAKNWVFMDDGTTTKKANLDLTKQHYDHSCKYPKEVAEAWVNSQGIGSATGWLFWANKWGQWAYIFTGSKGNWTLVKRISCGTGNINYGDGSDQGVGFSWKIWDKNKKFKGPQAYQYYNQHYTSLWGNSIHQGGSGKPCSHGCISLPKNGAIWVFNNVPINTRVVVF